MMNKIKGYKECAECVQIFYQTHLNQKFCCLDCSDKAEKKSNAIRAKRYLANQENHKKHLIRMATDRMLKKGKLQKHSCCICGSDNNIQMHHTIYKEDYLSAVMWLCKQHHEQLHKELEQ